MAISPNADVSTREPADDARPPSPSSEPNSQRPDWRFARRPFWVFSHLLAVSVIIAFVNFGFWQLRRLDERRMVNERIEAVMEAPVADLTTAGDLDGFEEFRLVSVTGTYVDDDVARVVNRSSDGRAGEYVVGVLVLSDGTAIAVNRGFVALDEQPVAAPNGQPVTIEGWVRPSVDRERFAASDSGTSELIPRLDTDLVERRFGGELPDNWLQISPDPSQASPQGSRQGSRQGSQQGSQQGSRQGPTPIPLPAIDEGPHLGYALQWFTFAAMTAVFYPALLRRQSRRRPDAEVAQTLR